MKQKQPHLIEMAWQDYARQCVPAKPGSTQYEESKKAFFGGAIVVMTSLLMASQPDVPESAAFVLLGVIEEELEAFKTKMDAVYADKFKRNRPENN